MTAHVGSGTLPCEASRAPAPTAPAEPVVPITVRAHVFFDGTQNNMYNTDAGALDVPWYRLDRMAHRGAFGEGSYGNSYSNIARLFRNPPTERNEDDYKEFSFYVEGMGTSRGNLDDMTTGVALGVGDTGVWHRVVQARDQLRAEIERRCNDESRPITIELTTWGFSRGAASARHFVWRVLTSGSTSDTLLQLLTTDGYQVTGLTFIFAGLFDTVASYQIDHDDDVAQLHLRSVRLAQRVVHLAAADEVRENFRLTNIHGCRGHGTEVFLPGVHSDLGGGYQDSVDDSVIAFDLPLDRNGAIATSASMDYVPEALEAQIDEEQRQRADRFTRERTWLVQRGWCGDAPGDITATGTTLRIRRPGIRNTYSFIPLRIMARFASDNGITFQPELQTLYRPDATLEALHAEGGQSVEAYLMAYALGGRSSGDDWDAVRPWLATLRRSWFHFSAKYDSMGLAPQYFSMTDRWGTSYRHILNGERKRRVMDG